MTCAGSTWSNAIFKQFGLTPLLKQSFINLQRKEDITNLLIFVNLVSATVYLVGFLSLNCLGGDDLFLLVDDFLSV